MEITVNNKPRTFAGESLQLTELLQACEMPQKGIAVAINNKVVRKGDWPSTEVKDGDSIMVIQAVCGG